MLIRKTGTYINSTCWKKLKQSPISTRAEMIQAILKKPDSGESKEKDVKVEEEKYLKSKHRTDKYLKIAAFVLLTLGLCIIVATFYLAIHRKFDDKNRSEKIIPGDENDKNHSDDNDDGSIIVEIVTNRMSVKMTEIDNATLQGCEEKLCKIICMNAKSFNEALEHTIKESKCSSIDSLIVSNQYFEDGVLHSNWVQGEHSVKELALVNSKITTIKTAAFNTSIFSTTFLLYWHNLNIEKINSGALVGLRSLKYLIIDTPIGCFDRAFFEPVQTKLRFLKIHAGLSISSEESFFGTSTMENLEYADLSRNNINGSITNMTFRNAPNLKYLSLAKCKISAVNEDAFDHLAGKLLMLDLSYNMLTFVGYNTLLPLLKGNKRFTVNLAMNSFICNCYIKPFLWVHKKYRNQFIDCLYCKGPHKVYGKLLDEVDLKYQNCTLDELTLVDDTTVNEDDLIETTLEPIISKETTISSKIQFTTAKKTDFNKGTHSVQMRCWHNPETYESIEARLIKLLDGGISSIDSDEFTTTNPMVDGLSSSFEAREYPIDSLKFQAPDYEFELYKFENNSVKVEITDTIENAINVVWFAEDVEEFSTQVPCRIYTNPYLITEPLIENMTYTFCLVPQQQIEITPFNCLPLHIAPKIEPDDIWISHEQKQFTIGMLCILFLMSIFVGAVIAYFGIRAYPDLLEGSKNVLVVKKSDKTCYVSTISEADYMKKASLKKRLSNSSIQKSSLPTTPSSMSIPSTISTVELDRLSSLKSSSTFFEDAFNPMPCLDDEYEMPKPMDKPQNIYKSRSIPNTYVATSPRRSPPPLPKRNSTANFTDYAF